MTVRPPHVTCLRSQAYSAQSSPVVLMMNIHGECARIVSLLELFAHSCVLATRFLFSLLLAGRSIKHTRSLQSSGATFALECVSAPQCIGLCRCAEWRSRLVVPGMMCRPSRSYEFMRVTVLVHSAYAVSVQVVGRFSHAQLAKWTVRIARKTGCDNSILRPGSSCGFTPALCA